MWQLSVYVNSEFHLLNMFCVFPLYVCNIISNVIKIFFTHCADILFGMPSTSAGKIEMKLATEHSRFLVAELNVRVSGFL